MRVAIAGAGNVGVFIANDLVDGGPRGAAHRAEPATSSSAPTRGRRGRVARRRRVRSRRRCAQAGLERCDVVVAATGDDEDNLVDLAARQAGVRRAARHRARQSPEERVAVQRELGRRPLACRRRTSSPRSSKKRCRSGGSCASCSSRAATSGSSRSRSPTNAPVVDQAIRDLDIPRDATIVAVVRGEHVVMPRGDTDLRSGRRSARDGDRPTPKTTSAESLPAAELERRDFTTACRSGCTSRARGRRRRRRPRGDAPTGREPGDRAAAEEHRGDRAAPVAAPSPRARRRRRAARCARSAPPRRRKPGSAAATSLSGPHPACRTTSRGVRDPPHRQAS